MTDIQMLRCKRLRELMATTGIQNNPLACRVLGRPPYDDAVRRLARRIGNWKGGYDSITPKYLVPLARALNVPPPELYIEPEDADEEVLFATPVADLGAEPGRNGHAMPAAPAQDVPESEVEPADVSLADLSRLRSQRLRKAMRAANVKAEDLAPLLAPHMQLPVGRALRRIQGYRRSNGGKCVSMPEILLIADRLGVPPEQLWVRLAPWERQSMAAMETARRRSASSASGGTLTITLRAGDSELKQSYPLTFDRRSRCFTSPTGTGCRIGPDGKEVRIRLDEALDVAQYYVLAMAALD